VRFKVVLGGGFVEMTRTLSKAWLGKKSTEKGNRNENKGGWTTKKLLQPIWGFHFAFKRNGRGGGGKKEKKKEKLHVMKRGKNLVSKTEQP